MSVRSNVKQFSRGLSRFQKRQLPFATSVALNDTAFQVRGRIVNRTYPRAFTVRNRRFPATAFRVVKATKRRLVAAVVDRLGRASLALHAEGGTKRPKGRHLAAPSRNIGRTKTGKVRKSRSPSAWLNSGRAFKGRLRKSTPAIFSRIGPGGRRLQLLYTLIERAPLARRFPFYEDAERVVRRAFPHNFRKAFRKALRTARR